MKFVVYFGDNCIQLIFFSNRWATKILKYKCIFKFTLHLIIKPCESDSSKLGPWALTIDM